MEAMMHNGSEWMVSPVLTGGASILVVEDDDSVRKVVHAILASQGYRVTEAETGEKALEIFRSSARGFDLLLTDIAMPGLPGTQVAEKLRNLDPGIRVVFMTGYAAGETWREAGENLIVQKPFSSRELLEAVRWALADR